MHGSCRSRWMVRNHAPCSFRTPETPSRCPQSVVSITMMGDERHEWEGSQLTVVLTVLGIRDPQVFRGKGGGRPQTEPEITHTINEEREQHIAEPSEVTHEAYLTCHCQGFPLGEFCPSNVEILLTY
jgi:hypothetical protein